MTTLAAGLTAVTSLVSGVAGYTTSQYQAMVAKQNSKIAGENARRTLDEGQQEKIDNDFEIRGLIGEQLAIQSGSGLSLSSRSAQAVRHSSRLIGEQEGARIMAKTMQEAKNFKQQQADFKAESKAHKVSGAFDLAGGILGAAAAAAGGHSEYKAKSLVSKASPTEMNSRFVPRPKLKPTRLRYVGNATYGGPR